MVWFMDGSHIRSWLADRLVLTLHGRRQDLPVARSMFETLFPPSVRPYEGQMGTGFMECSPLRIHSPAPLSPRV